MNRSNSMFSTSSMASVGSRRRANKPSSEEALRPRASPTRGKSIRGLHLMKDVMRSFSFSSTGGSIRSLRSVKSASPRDTTQTTLIGNPTDGRCQGKEEYQIKKRRSTPRLTLSRSQSLASTPSTTSSIPRRTLRKSWSRSSARRCSDESIPNRPPKTSHLRIQTAVADDKADKDDHLLQQQQMKKTKEQRRKRSLSRSRHSLPRTLQAKLEDKETMAYITSSVNECVESSSFLLNHSNSASVPLLQLQDVHVGEKLGKGAFSNVYRVIGIDHGPQKSGGNDAPYSSESLENARSSNSSQATPTIVQEITARGTGNYAIKIPKHPEEGLSSRAASMLRVVVHRSPLGANKNANTATSSEEDPKIEAYARACIDLILEGKYLSAMDHPNIIKIRGIGVSDPQTSPFLVMDRLHDTLDKRIEQWRKSSSSSSQSQQPRRGSYTGSGVDPMSSCSSVDHYSNIRRAPPQRRKSMGNSFRVHSFRKKRESAPSMCALSVSSSSATSFSSSSCSEDVSVASSARVGTTTTTSRPRTLLEEKAGYALEIAQALEYMHQHRIILRDLKPNNVGFVTVRGRGEDDGGVGRDVVQLFDFGLCRELPPQEERSSERDRKEEDHEFHMSIAGTTRFMAPEIINTDGVYGLKADIYSWGILCYEMLTLERPYASICKSPEIHKRFVCRDGVRPLFPSHNQCLRDTTTQPVPLPVQKLIQSAWAQNQTDRPSASVVCSQLQSLLMNDFKASSTTAPVVLSPSNLNRGGSTTTKDYTSVRPSLIPGTASSVPPTATPTPEDTSTKTQSHSEPLPTRAIDERPTMSRSLSGQDLLDLLTDPDFEANLEAALTLQNHDSFWSHDHPTDATGYSDDDDDQNNGTAKAPEPLPLALIEPIDEARSSYLCTA